MSATTLSPKRFAEPTPALPQPLGSALARDHDSRAESGALPLPAPDERGVGVAPPALTGDLLLSVECPKCSAPAGQDCAGSPLSLSGCHGDRLDLVREAAWSRFRAVVFALEEPTPCAGENAYTDEDDDELRAIAALYCEACPIIHECRQAGMTARLPYVWGGIDLGTKLPPLAPKAPRRLWG